MTNLRHISYSLLTQWNPETGFAASLIEGAARRHRLTGRDRAFLNSLVLGVLRNITLLDNWIDYLRSRGQLKRNVRWLLRQGLYEVLLMRTPDHAAVSQAVKLAKRYEKGIVNAVLRRAVKESDTLTGRARDLPLPVRFSLPKHIVDGWQHRLGADAAVALCEWMNEPAPVTLRANPLKPGAADALRASFGAVPVEDQPGFFTVLEVPFEAIRTGLCYVQDPSTALAPSMLAPKRGDSVLDACAAPGGKAGILAAMMANEGRLVCVDRQRERIDMTHDNLKRLGVTCAEFYCHDWQSDAKIPDLLTSQQFDRILVDVPCSNTGVMRRRVDVRWRLNSSREIAALNDAQLAIVDRVLPLLKPAGTLVYSTCSIEPSENEGLIQKLLTHHPDLFVHEDQLLLPHINDTDGGYAAILKKSRSFQRPAQLNS